MKIFFFMKWCLSHNLSWFWYSNAIFYDKGSQLWALISQAILGKNKKFLCSLDWKFSEFFKTHLTFICRLILILSTGCPKKVYLQYWGPPGNRRQKLQCWGVLITSPTELHQQHPIPWRQPASTGWKPPKERRRNATVMRTEICMVAVVSCDSIEFHWAITWETWLI